jgi:hypothetical protein
MALGALDLVTVRGEYRWLDDSLPLAGSKVTFRAQVDLREHSEPLIILRAPIIVNVSTVDGTFSIDLPATDDPDVTPTGFVYEVTEHIVGPDGAYGRPRFNISVPLATPGGVLDLADVAPTTATTPNFSYVLASAHNTLAARVTELEEGGVGGGPHADADHADAFDAIGTATAAVNAHTAASDPHAAYLLADGTRPLTADLDLDGNKVVSVADGTADQDAVTVAQLNTAIGGLTGGTHPVTLGDGVSSEFVVSHSLGTDMPTVVVVDNTDGQYVEVLRTRVDDSNIMLTFGSVPDIDQYDVELGHPGATGGASGTIGPYTETRVDLSADDGVLDLAAGNQFVIPAPTGPLTVTVDNIPAGSVVTSFAVLFEQATPAVAVTWPFDAWTGDGAPAMGDGELWLVAGTTYDNGTTLIGSASEVA